MTCHILDPDLGPETQRSGCLGQGEEPGGLTLPNCLTRIYGWKEKRRCWRVIPGRTITGDTRKQMPSCLGTGDKPVELKSFLLSTHPTEEASFGHPVPIPPPPLQKEGYQMPEGSSAVEA